ncbi:TIGR00159 family protein [Pseudoflavonifractor capillosus]|uniref:diadenylate cyclase CdaA n=1 Tax=Pseudoflavonifractor TaxID=1017280 RepID=UPI000B378F52|nr:MULTISPECIES: diadenylate cyclase CdaA [Pseudoflavonifractor]MBM6693569.1 TIGR00159 family protein [Pseudoflavonifractor capillosus]NJE73126.1 TIGR00159 family protein [Pseudoflavonifractor sp. SW1122]OUN99374.1 TIGR00159 family protein [Pseudoflavonifractor sp. An44]
MEYIEQFLRTVQEYVKLIGFFDVLDMAIVAFVVYHIFRFVRRSRSGQVVKAILLIVVALGVANLLQLQVVSFVLNNAVELGFIALVIIFQPEIRRFLEQMGSGKIKEIFVQETIDDELEYAIRETVEAYTSLSKDKVGALMVFERKTMLDDVLKTGTPLDARVSAELLKNLFWNKAPLHDGAVIVRNGRIVGAGCMLPMSGNVNISRDLGMRHRAGIGISENSDAVVALVSEETGSISVAINGMLKRHLAPATLEQMLRNELMPKQEESKPSGTAWLTNMLKPIKGDKPDGEEDSRQ